jgi:glutamine synthetase adenylyltransferase
VEHSLQLLHNQQTHELPSDQRQLEWLANRMDYPDAATLMLRFNEHRLAVRTIFDESLQFESRTTTGAADTDVGRQSAIGCRNDPDPAVALSLLEQQSRTARRQLA